jgi:hypothetical protein
MTAERRCPRCHQPWPQLPAAWLARVEREGLITLKAAAELLGYGGRSPEAGIVSAIKRGTLRAVDASGIYRNLHGRRSRMVYRAEVEVMRERRVRIGAIADRTNDGQ